MKAIWDMISGLFGAIGNLLTANGSGPMSDDDRTYHVYVKPKMCKEILKVRIDMMNGPSRTDDGKGFYLRKLARGTRCPFEVEMEFWWDGRRRLENREINNGEWATYEEYEAFVEAKANS